jgi:hypothetical protein
MTDLHEIDSQIDDIIDAQLCRDVAFLRRYAYPTDEEVRNFIALKREQYEEEKRRHMAEVRAAAVSDVMVQ